MIVDSHTHVMSADRARYPLRPDLGAWFHGAGDVGSLLATLDGAGVDAAVLVQFVGGYGYDCSYAADALAAAPDRLALVGAVDMYGDDPADDLRRLATKATVRAVRVFGVGTDEPFWLWDGRAEAVWAAAHELGIGIVATLWDRDLPALRPLVEARPEVMVAVDHCGFVDLETDPAPLLLLADLPPIHVKVTSLVLGPLVDPASAVRTLADAFGAERLAWGSDHPQTDGDYGEMVALAERSASLLGTGAKADFLGGTARRLWFGR